MNIVTTFGYEATYFCDIDGKNFGDDQYYATQGLIARGIKNLSDAYEKSCIFKGASRDIKDFHRFIKLTKNTYSDENVIEIPSKIYKEGSHHRAFSDFEFVNKYLNTNFNIFPSSMIAREYEGGCHMNFDIDGKTSFFKTLVRKKLCSLIYENAYICWYFLQPLDNESSSVRTLNARSTSRRRHSSCVYQDNDRIELRFFEMPTSTEEFILHYDFCIAILNYAAKSDFKLDVKFYTGGLKKSIESMKQFCNEINFDYQRLVDFGKEQNIIDRYSLKDKKYLN